jgi:hypothetical protein
LTVTSEGELIKPPGGLTKLQLALVITSCFGRAGWSDQVLCDYDGDEASTSLNASRKYRMNRCVLDHQIVEGLVVKMFQSIRYIPGVAWTVGHER